jgi:hypothetical protein
MAFPARVWYDATVVRFVLAAIPACMIAIGTPLLNRTEPRVFGLPFLMAWLLFWVLTIPVFLSVVERLRKPS